MLVTIEGGKAEIIDFKLVWDTDEDPSTYTAEFSPKATISSCDSDCFLLSLEDSSDVSKYAASVSCDMGADTSGYGSVVYAMLHLLPVGEGVSSVKAATSAVEDLFGPAEGCLPVSIGSVDLPTPFLRFCSIDGKTISGIESDITLIGGNGNDSNFFNIGDDKKC